MNFFSNPETQQRGGQGGRARGTGGRWDGRQAQRGVCEGIVRLDGIGAGGAGLGGCGEGLEGMG